MRVHLGLLPAVFVFAACAVKPVDPSAMAYRNTDDGRRVEKALTDFANSSGARYVASSPSDELPSAAESANRSSQDVVLHREGQISRLIPGPATSFKITTIDDKDEIEKLKAIIMGHRERLGGGKELGLRALNVMKSGAVATVRFQQLVERHAGKQGGFIVPVEGFGVVARLQGGRLVSLAGELAVPPSASFIWRNPGIDLRGFTARELDLIVGYLRRMSEQDATAEAIGRLSRASKIPFDLKAFASAGVSAQKEQLTALFAKLGSASTFRLLIELARKERLALVRHADTWFVQVSEVFELPIQFDVEIPTTTDVQLKARNLREMNQSVVINVYDSPSYPRPPNQLVARAVSESSAIEGRGAPTETVRLFQGVLNYYRNHHSWMNHSGSDPSGQLNVLTNLQSKDQANNAAWVPSESRIIVGAGGELLQNQMRSVSILGHEFAHAVVHSSSRLVYRGQSGALNEHFADVQGALIESEVSGQPYSYTVGQDAMNAAAIAPRKMLTSLILPTLKIPAESVRRFNLETIALRHLFVPALSYSTSYGAISDAPSTYGPSCQPSSTNDYCGVHSLSGIPNRAVSLIINKLGADRVRSMIFNTGTQRLAFNATFSEYLRQMYEECMQTPGLDPQRDCAVVIEAFAEVGVNYPQDAPRPIPVPPPPSNLPQDPPPQPNEPQPSPLLKMCGWVSINPSGNITIIDNKYDTAILVTKYETLTVGDYAAVRKYKCACVQGHILQTSNSKGVYFNYFADVVATQQRPEEACRPIQFK